MLVRRVLKDSREKLLVEEEVKFLRRVLTGATLGIEDQWGSVKPEMTADEETYSSTI